MDLKCSACNTLVFDERKKRTRGFRCIQCEDFVLCSDCERIAHERHFATHVFIVITKEHVHKQVKDFPLADKDTITVNMNGRHDYHCSVCELQTIVGVMYKCTHCDDFQVCSEDYEVNPKVHEHNPDHAFMKIPTIYAPLNEIIWDLDASSTWYKGKDEKDFLFDTNAMLKQLNDKKKAAKPTSGATKTPQPKPLIDKQSNARYLDGLATTQKLSINAQYTEESGKNTGTGTVTAHYTDALSPVAQRSADTPTVQYTNDLNADSQKANPGANELLRGNIVTSGYTETNTDRPLVTSGYTEQGSADTPLATSGYTEESSPASPNAEKLNRYIATSSQPPPLVYSSSDLYASGGSNGSLYSSALEYPEKSTSVKEELTVQPKPEVKQEEVTSPKSDKHKKEHKHKKEDSKSGLKRSKSEHAEAKHKKEKEKEKDKHKEKKSKKRSRSNSHGHRTDQTLTSSAPVVSVPISTDAQSPETCPKQKRLSKSESRVTRESRSTSMPEKKFKISLRKSHKSKSKSKLDDKIEKINNSGEVIVHPVAVEPVSVSKSSEHASPKSPRSGHKSPRKSPKAERPASVQVTPKKAQDLNAIADFYIETGLQSPDKKEDKDKKRKEKKKEKKSKKSKSSRRVSGEIQHSSTAPELGGRYTSAEELFEANRRLVEGEEPSVPLSASTPDPSRPHNYVTHFDTISSVQEPSKEENNTNAKPTTSYAANYLNSPPSAAVNYIANPNADPGVDVESESDEEASTADAQLGYNAAMNRKMYAATSYSNYGITSADNMFFMDNANAYGAQAIDGIESALEAKPLKQQQGPISMSKMVLRPTATEQAQTSGSGINWGDAYINRAKLMYAAKDKYVQFMENNGLVTPEMRQLVVDFQEHVQGFRNAASDIAKRIIDEAFLPLHEKTIKPADVGGIAGGQKYVYDGIFLKFAIDLFGVYGGDYAAAKASNRELQGLKGYYESQVMGLMVPPMLIIDYRGFRMVATPCLPISKDSLQYGSADGGQTVLKTSKDLNKKMKLAANRMKLKGHIVGTDTPTKIYGPADIEGHASPLEGVHFVIDTARVSPPFPPEKTISGILLKKDPVTTNPWVRLGEDSKLIDVPIKNLKNELRQYFPDLPSNVPLAEASLAGATLYFVPKEHLKELVLNRIASSAVHTLVYGDAILVYTFRLRGTQLYDLLRLELLQHPDVPTLSSDAFTFFQQSGIEKDKDEEDVRKAVNILTNKVIPQFADDMLNKRVNLATPHALVDEMHKRGINLKFLGVIRRYISDAGDVKLDSILTIEMVARASKYFLRSQLRRIKSRDIKQDEIKVILGNFNMVIGDSIASHYYWKFIIRALITAKFGPSFCDSEQKIDFDLRSAVNDKYALFVSLEAHTGIKFKDEIHQRLKADPSLFDQKIVVRAQDFQSLEARHRTWGDECIQKKLERITQALVANGKMTPMAEMAEDMKHMPDAVHAM